MMNKIRVAIADDQNLFRQSLGALIKTIPEFQLIVEAENGLDFLAKLKLLSHLPDVALIDIDMPLMNGVELNTILHQQYPGIKVIILSIHMEESLIAQLIDAGAAAYLVKNCDKDELVTAIQAVYKSGFYINYKIYKAVQENATNKNKPYRSLTNVPIELTIREKQILNLICRECTNYEIAENLFLSVRTIEGHRTNLLLKIGCRNTAGLVLFAVKNKILNDQ